MTYRIERTAVSTLRIWRDGAIMGHLQFRRDWGADRKDGWQYYPYSARGRKPSRVLRNDLCEALHLAARLPKQIACELAGGVS